MALQNSNSRAGAAGALSPNMKKEACVALCVAWTKGSDEDYDFVPVEWPYTGQTQVLGLESMLKQFLFASVVYDFRAVLTALTQSGGKK